MHFMHHHLPSNLHFFLSVAITLFLSASLFAKDAEWELYHIKLYTENDLLSQEDSQYTGGSKLDIVYKIDNPDSLYNLLSAGDSKVYCFCSFAIGSQIYTPADLTKKEPIYDDWSYAGWTYVESGIHKSSSDTLNSLILKVGIIGPDAQGEEIQKAIHRLTGSKTPQGWDNQLYNELGINLGYIYKKRYEEKLFKSLSVSVVPLASIDLGNISTQAALGVFIRFGHHISKDFGIATITMGGESGIPAYEAQKENLHNHWSWSLNFAARGSVVARDIFVQGNTFRTSIVTHELENFVGYIGGGFSLRYKSWNVDFMQIHNTPKAKDIYRSKTVGTLILSYFYK